MIDHFASPKSMLARAQRQIAELDAKINIFTEEKPWSHVVEKDVDGFTDVHKVKFTARLSEDLPHIVFETANNLRAVLDQLGFVVAIRAGKRDPKSCKFPIGPTESKMRNNAKGGCNDLPPEIRALFEGFNPYKGGNDSLWALNELANGPKHKLLFPIAIGGQTSFVRTLVFDGWSVQASVPTWDREKNEIEFLRTRATNKVQYNIDIAFTVALDNVSDVVRGQHPVAVLRTMAGVVESVLMATEAECRRIGLIA
jgi:hypothetical protein